MYLISTQVTKFLNNQPLVQHLGRVTSDNYATKEHKLIFDSCYILFGSDDLYKAFKMLNGKPEVLNLQNENSYKKTKVLICRWINKHWLVQNQRHRGEDALSILSNAFNLLLTFNPELNTMVCWRRQINKYFINADSFK